MQAIVKSISGKNITINVPLDYNFTTNAKVIFCEWNMNYDGSNNTLYYTISPPENVTWDITRIIFSITDDAAMDSTTFGGIASLPNGVVLRVKDDNYKNIFVVSDNGGFAERAYDVTYDDRRSPVSEYGFRVRRTFSGQDKDGVVIRLNGSKNEELQLIIQDDLTDITKFAANVQGHIVTMPKSYASS